MTTGERDLSTLEPAPLRATAEALRSGSLQLLQSVAGLLDRIDAVEPRILALLPERDRRERLFAEAEALERRYPEPEGRPPLYGVPVGVKDIFRVDGFETRAGSALPPELFTGPEAASVTRLRQAGALVLAKTVTTEFAQMEPASTRNPQNPAHTPGGSSSGSAAAVAAGLAPLALGSQTVGSTIRPAAFCGIVGFKPSFGRIETDGMLYCAPSLDHVGLFTQDAAGLTLAASVLLHDWRQGARAGQPPVIGVPEGPFLAQAEPEGLEALESQLRHLESAGFHVRRVSALEDVSAVNARHLSLMAYEFAEVHRDWYDSYGALYRPGSSALVEAGRATTAEQAEGGRRSQRELRQRLHDLMEEHTIDLWSSPPAAGAAPRGLASTGMTLMNLPWTHAGLPTIALPASRASNGLPLGLQLSARFGADEELLAWAETLEPVLATWTTAR